MHLLSAVQAVKLDINVLNLIVGVFIPLLVALLTKAQSPAVVKVAVNAVLSAATGALTLVINQGGTLHWQQFVMSIFTVAGTSILTYLGIWKPTGAEPALARATNGFGVGPQSGAVTPVASVPNAATESPTRLDRLLILESRLAANIRKMEDLLNPRVQVSPTPPGPTPVAATVVPGPSEDPPAAKRSHHKPDAPVAPDQGGIEPTSL